MYAGFVISKECIIWLVCFARHLHPVSFPNRPQSRRLYYKSDLSCVYHLV
jgi:hypothetical protein